MSATQPVRTKHQVCALAEFYLKRGELRNHLFIVMGVHTAPRISDLLRLKWDDVFDFENNCIRESITITEKKTGKTKLITLNKSIVAAISVYVCVAMRGEHLINSRRGGAIGRIPAYRNIRAAAEVLGFHSHVSCHSLRKTFGCHTKKTQNALRVLNEKPE